MNSVTKAYSEKKREWKKKTGKSWKHVGLYNDPPSHIQEMVMREGVRIRALNALGPDEIEDAFNYVVICGQMARKSKYSLRR